MDLSNVAISGLLSAALAHPYGHVSEGGKKGVPMRVDYRNMVEKWEGKAKNKKDETDIHGAGFETQDKVGRATKGSKLEESMRLVNSLYKLGYMMGIKSKGTPGDFDLMEQSSGNKYTKPLVGLSALADLYKAKNPNSKGDLSFSTFGQGAPGLLYTRRF